MNLIARIIYAIGGFIVAVCGLRLLLVLLGASATNGFANFIYQISEPFVRPFFGLFNYTPSYGAFHFEFATFIAIIVYAVATALLGGLLGYTRHSTTY